MAEEHKYDYKKEVDYYRAQAEGYREQANTARIIYEDKVKFLMEMAERADILAKHIQRLCSSKE